MHLYLEDDYVPSKNWVDKIRDMYEEDYLMHVGVAHDDNPPGRGSGRYAWGSGGRPHQREWDFYSSYEKLKRQGMSEADIARGLGVYKTDHNGNILYNAKGEPIVDIAAYRAYVHMASGMVRKDTEMAARELLDAINPETGKPYTNIEIADMVGRTEGWVRQLRKDPDRQSSIDKTDELVKQLKDLVEKGEYIDVGNGAELMLGCSHDRLLTALKILEDEGYPTLNINVNQVGTAPGQQTTIKVLCKPETEFMDLVENKYKIKAADGTGIDDESVLTSFGMQEPNPIDISRVDVRYKEDGGAEKDGVVAIRAIVGEDGKLYPACPDLSLGNALYAQVRIAVDGGDEYGAKYIKGMAIYDPDLPEGTDVLVYSNKSVTQGIGKALKDMKVNPDGTIDLDNPFGSTVYQSEYESGKLSSINIVGDIWGKNPHQEGAWDEWSRNLPSQFLGKQSEELIKQQLKLDVDRKRAELAEIMAVDNPTVRKQLLLDFAEECDGAAVDLKAAPLPGQRVKVLLPVEGIGENEVYAPGYETGQTLALVRFPHAGTFEIPIVKVNNSLGETDARFMKEAQDAIGISSTTANILSGADFDGDTAIVIPMTRKNSEGEFEKTVNIKGIGNGATKLPGMDNFDPKSEYAGLDDDGEKIPGVRYMTKTGKGTEMGKVSNLITDMTLKGCEDAEELARAVKYSMVVIDAEKHKLNYLQAKEDYNIQQLYDEYQAKPNGKSGGASTILSRASGQNEVPQRKAGYRIDEETGEKVYQTVSDEKRTYVDKNGKERLRTTSSTNMAEAKDAYELLSDNPSNKEIIYADYANTMKSMANNARKTYVSTKDYERSPEAAKIYAEEVAELSSKLNEAKKNAPRERQAQLLANRTISSRYQENPVMSDEERRKLRGQALTGARERTGAQKQRVTFTDRQVEAINAGAISASRLRDLLKNSNSEHYRSVFTPTTYRISNATATLVKDLMANGWTREQIVSSGYASMDTIRQIQQGNYEH